MNRKGIHFKSIARVLFLVMAFELISPAVKTYALTGGPSQPEVQSFEPVGTTDMVDPFSGDFVYNIPLLDVDGYPINIAYHSGIGVEDEASWVGLGWNINPGAINRSVRGLPDDYKGDKLYKLLKMKAEKEWRLKFGMSLEVAGLDKIGDMKLSLNFGNYITFNNYKGVGIGFSGGVDFKFPGVATAGLGVAVSSNEGADIDTYASLLFTSSTQASAVDNFYGLRVGTGFNTRTGLKALSFGMSFGNTYSDKQSGWNRAQSVSGGISMGTYIPIGLQNYVATLSNPTKLSSWEFTAKFGTEALLFYPHFSAALYSSKLEYEPEGTRSAFGFMYLQDANDESIVDFSRERDGVYNMSLPHLPLSNMTYDVFSVSGQGTGGMFRPFRGDIGTVYDPAIKQPPTTSVNAGAEVGVGAGFEIGANLAYYTNNVQTGPSKRGLFKQNTPNSLFENVYFKQAGELTNNLAQDNNAIASHAPVRVDHNLNTFGKTNQSLGAMPSQYTAAAGNYPRAARATSIATLTNDQVRQRHTTYSAETIKSYPRNSFYDNNGGIQDIQRSNSPKDQRQAHHIGEITQLQPDGRTYVYGISAMNNVQKEVTVKITAPEPGSAAYQTGLVDLPGAYNNDYTQVTVTPAYAHSYLLTAVLSADYVDVTGDGLTDDDLGDFVKFNYTRTASRYFWRSPYQNGKAQFNPGFYSDIQDDKASYITGSKEIWYLHSIETKNNVAEFTISERLDAKGLVAAPINNSDFASGSAGDFSSDVTTPLSESSAEQKQYRLDNIKLYSKTDRYVNKQNAVPIRSVFFDYDYLLCGGTPNSASSGNKKLTLKRIYFKNGNSEKSLLNPYVFDYNEQTNYTYAYAAKDRWGNYKPNDVAQSNFENPYVTQDTTTANQYASAWLLNKVKLPSGGELNINYESDDYSYVQDKDVTEMVRVQGVGLGPAFEPKDVLYEGGQVNNYVYFKVDQNRLAPGKSLEENYFRNNPDRLLYFSFLVDLPARNRYEPIKGYAKVESVGYCPGTNNQYGYFKLKNEKMGHLNNKNIHPITLGALNIGRYHLPQILYPGSTTQYDNAGGQEILNGLKDAAQSLLTAGRDLNQSFVNKGLAKSFDVQKSWIKTSTPGYNKLGGGSRVRSLQLADKWNTMASNGSNSVTGKYYDYTMQNPETGTRTSSGVASYEPLIGGEENPLRKPINYTGDAGRLLPPVELYQEGPIGESFYPGAIVGYRQVSVTSIHRNEGRSSKSLDVTEFYTAKDFPVYVDFTPVNKDVSKRRNTFLYKMEDIAVSQGYVLYLNDMHGKLKGSSNYVMKEGDNKELITSVKYNYKTDNNGRLNNQVNAVVRQAYGNSNGASYAVKSATLGEEIDYTVDNRQRYMSSLSSDININLNVAMIGIFPLVVPAVFTPPKTEESWFKTASTTKIIQQYGIVASVENYNHGAKTIVHNVLFDGTSGQVVMTKTANDYNDPVSNLNFPAHWSGDQFGPAYTNIGYEENVETLSIDSNYNGTLSGIDDCNRYAAGDELWLMVNNSSGVNIYKNRVWVTSGIFTAEPSGQIHIVPRAKYLNGNVNTPWLAKNTTYNNVKVKVLRSGRRNRLIENMQQFVFKGTYDATDYISLFNFVPQEMISVSTLTYSDAALNSYNRNKLNIASYGYNDFVMGLRGNPKPERIFSDLKNRKYDNNHSRTDGTFQPMGLYRFFPNGIVWGGPRSLFMYDSGMPGSWHVLKSMQYDNSGNQVQEIDASGKASAVLYGYKNSLPVGIADNATLAEITYLGFDDLFLLYHQNSTHLGQIATFRDIDPLTPIYNSNGQSYQVYNYPYFLIGPSNTFSIVADAHTGKYGLKALSSFYNLSLYTTHITGNMGKPDLFFSMWVKPPAGTTLNAAAFTVNGSTPFTATTSSIEGWYKLECRKSSIPDNTALYISIPGNYIVDDVRVCPNAANMKTFTYDPITRRLLAQMDENNYATFYEYDAEGQLVRTKKETDKGILTLTESRISTKK